MKWLCLSGWAVEHGKLSRLLEDEDVKEVDFHFYSEGEFPDINKYIPESPYSILCYSMGTLPALKAVLLSKPVQIVCIAGFANFTGTGPDAKRRTLQILQMIKSLKKDTTGTIREFTAAAGLKPPFKNTFNVNNLIKGLELLKDCDMSQALDTELTITLVSSDNDKIVPEHISNQLLSGPGERKHIILPGSHGTWQSQSEEFSRILRG